MSLQPARLLGMCIAAGLLPAAAVAQDAKSAPKYFAHSAVEDSSGVIAPWYRGQNGQCDFRIRVAAETLKRYPWADKDTAVMAAPHFIFNGHWSIKPDGAILPSPNLSDWDNADIGQRSASLLYGLTGYYRYMGDAAAIGLVKLTADHLLDYCQTPADHPWPTFPISAPTQGKPYGRANPRGFIQLDLSAQLGSGMILAYKLTGEPRYLEAVKHWADLLAAHCDYGDGKPPWNRYANPEDVKWGTRETAGVSLILQFLNETIRLGYEGKDGALVKARDAGEGYLRQSLLPEWSRDATFGHHFWDWEQAVYGCGPVWYTADYMMNRREAFPNWQSDVRNFVSLYFCRTSVDPASKSGPYSGAWALPESSGCCGQSLQYSTMSLAAPLARYGVLADSAWAREVARRQTVLSTYDAHETGVVEDGVGGGIVVTGAWYNLAHPWPLRCVLEMLAWQPQLGANRENHVMRSSSVVRTIRYGKGQVAYSTFDGASRCEDVLRLAFLPKRVVAGGRALQVKTSLSENGYTVQPLANGDAIVTIRHDGLPDVLVEGDDPQQVAEDTQLTYSGPWQVEPCAEASGGTLHVASAAGAETSFTFEGNQVRLLGRFGPRGGKADVYLDGVKQLCGIDCWCPDTRYQQVLYYKSGLTQGKHTLRVVLLGAKNPVAQGTRLCIDAVQWSAAQGEAGFGEGGGPAEPQRVICGYLGRKEYVDRQGGVWRPATEFVLRLASNADLLPVSFSSQPRVKDVAGTADPELYRYGVHGRDFTAYFTVAPAETYRVRLKFCQAEKSVQPGQDATSIELQGKEVFADLDVAARAGGLGKAVDLVYEEVRPVHGMIAIRFWNRGAGKAMVQAIEIVPGAAKTVGQGRGASSRPVLPRLARG